MNYDGTPTRDLAEYILRDDPLEFLLSHGDNPFSALSKEISTDVEASLITPGLAKLSFESLDTSMVEKEEPVDLPILPSPELKPLPESLKYTFLGPNSTYPVIINASLEEEQVEKLLGVIRSHRKALGYSIDDLIGISPSLCMHRIYMEENYKASIES